MPLFSKIDRKIYRFTRDGDFIHSSPPLNELATSTNIQAEFDSEFESPFIFIVAKSPSENPKIPVWQYIYIVNPIMYDRGIKYKNDIQIQQDRKEPLKSKAYCFWFNKLAPGPITITMGPSSKACLFVWGEDWRDALSRAAQWLHTHANNYLISKTYYRQMEEDERDKHIFTTIDGKHLLNDNFGIVFEYEGDKNCTQLEEEIITTAWNLSVAMYHPEFLAFLPEEWMKPF